MLLCCGACAVTPWPTGIHCAGGEEADGLADIVTPPPSPVEQFYEGTWGRGVFMCPLSFVLPLLSCCLSSANSQPFSA